MLTVSVLLAPPCALRGQLSVRTRSRSYSQERALEPAPSGQGRTPGIPPKADDEDRPRLGVLSRRDGGADQACVKLVMPCATSEYPFHSEDKAESLNKPQVPAQDVERARWDSLHPFCLLLPSG